MMIDFNWCANISRLCEVDKKVKFSMLVDLEIFNVSGFQSHILDFGC